MTHVFYSTFKANFLISPHYRPWAIKSWKLTSCISSASFFPDVTDTGLPENIASLTAFSVFHLPQDREVRLLFLHPSASCRPLLLCPRPLGYATNPSLLLTPLLLVLPPHFSPAWFTFISTVTRSNHNVHLDGLTTPWSSQLYLLWNLGYVHPQTNLRSCQLPEITPPPETELCLLILWLQSSTLFLRDWIFVPNKIFQPFGFQLSSSLFSSPLFRLNS